MTVIGCLRGLFFVLHISKEELVVQKLPEFSTIEKVFHNKLPQVDNLDSLN